jgi:hypothetical protein
MLARCTGRNRNGSALNFHKIGLEAQMIKAWDADGHVSESEVTFSDKYWDPKLKDRRPSIVETGPDGPLYWMIDTRSFPVRSGPYQQAGFPLSRNGVSVSISSRRRIITARRTVRVVLFARPLVKANIMSLWWFYGFPSLDGKTIKLASEQYDVVTAPDKEDRAVSEEEK